MSEWDWLPPLLQLGEFANFDAFIDAAYDCFRADFVESKPTLLGKVVLHAGPRKPGDREDGFYHITSSTGPWGRKEDVPRCERIRYPRALIEAVPSPRVHAWRDPYRKNRLHITLPDFSYLVVLEEKRASWMLITAYPIYATHQQRGLRKRWEAGDQIC